MQTCGHVDADGCKQKRKKEKTNLAGRVCGWVCGRAGMRMGMQPCGHADGCKQKGKRKKEKKHLLIGSERADGRAEADDCKERKKERKGKKKERLTGFQSGRMGVRECACGQT